MVNAVALLPVAPLAEAPQNSCPLSLEARLEGGLFPRKVYWNCQASMPATRALMSCSRRKGRCPEFKSFRGDCREPGSEEALETFAGISIFSKHDFNY